MAIIYKTLTIDTTAFGTGDVVGGAITVSGFNPGLLTAITVYDADGEGVQLDFFIFGDALAGTYTNNAAFSVNSADESKILGVASLPAANYLAAGSDKIGTIAPVNIMVKGDAFYCVPVIRSTTTFTATTDLRLVFHIMER